MKANFRYAAKDGNYYLRADDLIAMFLRIDQAPILPSEAAQMVTDIVSKLRGDDR